MTPTDLRGRRRALYALCTGMLMIVLDATIVNVALPSIQRGPRVLGLRAGLGDQRVPDRVRRPAAARRPARRPRRPAPDLPGRAGRVHRRVGGLRRGGQPGHAHRRPVRAGRGRRADVGGDPQHDRDLVPGAAGAGPRGRRVRVRRVRRRCGRAARRRRADPVRSTGTGSSSSTCRSAWRPWRGGPPAAGRDAAGPPGGRGRARRGC